MTNDEIGYAQYRAQLEKRGSSPGAIPMPFGMWKSFNDAFERAKVTGVMDWSPDDWEDQ